MNPDDLAAILDELGRRLGPSGERVFELAVRQQYVSALTMTVFGVVLLAVTAAGLVVFRRLRADQWARWNALSPSDRQFTTLHGRPGNAEVVCVSTAAGIGILLGALLLNGALNNVLNPEYSAIRDLLSAVRGTP